MIKENKRFYFKTETENNEAFEVYIGQNAGNQLYKELINAENEVLIVSPYIDEAKLDDLINLKNRGINVRLAFNDLRKEQYYQVLRKLIFQHKNTDLKKKEKKEKNKNIYLFLTVAFLTFGMLILTQTLISVIGTKSLTINNVMLFSFSLIAILLSYMSWNKRSQINKSEIYYFNYSEKLNFKFIRNNKFERKFVHSKIYVIDRKVAYLGSLNFTNNGFTTNFETRIRITQKEKIDELVEFIHEIFEDNVNFKPHELDYLGKQAYTEETY